MSQYMRELVRDKCEMFGVEFTDEVMSEVMNFARTYYQVWEGCEKERVEEAVNGWAELYEYAV